MRITLVSPFDPRPAPDGDGSGGHVGGVERVYDEVAGRLVRRGHEATVVCSTAGPSGDTVERGVRLVRRHRPLTVLRAPVCRLSRRIPPDTDLVQVAATYPFTTPAVLWHAHRRGIPAVLDFHFEPAPASAAGRMAATAYGRLGPRLYRFADVVVARSKAYARRAPSLAGIPRGRLRIVPNGIDPRVFRPHGPRHDGDYLLFVGRLVPYKGVDVLLEALARARIDVPLVLVGEGPLRAPLEARAKELGVDARFLGRVEDEELPALYRGARLTVLPSVNQQEAFGIVLLESMACGTPVVASALPGVEEVARIGGLVARPEDPEALAWQIQKALESESLPRGAMLAARVRREYSWDAVTDRMVDVYEKVLEDRAAGAATPQAG